MRKIAELWEKVEPEIEKKVKCKVCAHYCVIPPGKRGFCRTRENIDGQLYTLVYGAAIHGGSNDPVEKKPLYHFYPGSTTFSIATIGCNFRCKHCQNWDISQAFPDKDGVGAEFSAQDAENASTLRLSSLTPEEVVNRAKRMHSKSISYTYNEPTIWFEFVKDCARLAHEAGLKNILVTNGFSSPESNQEFVRFIDAANVDIKAFTDRFYQKVVGVPSFQPVLETCKFFKQHGVHIEITNLIIPNENDDLDEIKNLVLWVRDNLGKDTPLHFSAYYPRYRMRQPPTSGNILTQAWKLAIDNGLEFVYMGNVRSDEGSHTKCPHCHSVLIERFGYQVKNLGINPERKCKKCGESIPVIGEII
jgi:pyruvate formate lyase activating enzyme